MRLLLVFARLLPFILAFARDRRRLLLLGGPARRTEADHRARAKRLVRTLAGLGPTYIKLAQLFASRADILPEPYLGEIATLTDAVPPLPAGSAEQVVREELGAPVREVFERWDPEPIAAASLGQVHRASYQGREVVVKVLRPGVARMVQEDLDIAFRMIVVLALLFPGHQVQAISNVVNEFAKRIRDELDFREEAKHAATVRGIFAGTPRVVVPDVVTTLVRRRVLVLEFVEGTRVDRLADRIARGETSLADVMGTVVDAYLKMILEDGILHADPHPGNLLWDDQGRLVLLDFGMVLRVDPGLRDRIMRTMLAAQRRDVDGMVSCFYELGLLDPDADRAVIRDAATRLMAISLRPDLSPRQVQRIVEEIFQTFYEFPLLMPSDLVYFMRAGMLVEGLGYRYDPNFNLIPILEPRIPRYTAKLVAGEASDASGRLAELGQEALNVLRQARDVLRRLERDEIRVRLHPRDQAELHRFLKQQVRRVLLSLVAFTIGLISVLVWSVTRRFEILVTGLFFAGGMFTVIFLLPSHLFRNPLRMTRWPGT
ncbi:MAG: AarF/UbiB family protein [Gemmatimonadales bacterium]|nr:AarF/UbiB family protein [Gemmatimonadales bacterium]